MIKLVVVDFDDTLTMTEEATFHIENETAALLGYPPMTRATHLKGWGKALEEAIPERIPGVDVDEFMEKLSEVHMKYIKEGSVDVINEENMRFLDSLKKSEKRLAIVTSRTIGEVRHLLEKDHPLNSRIEKLYYKGTSQYVKPDPRVFDEVIRDFQVRPEEAVYIGDSPGDAVASKGAGMHFIAVLASGFRTEEDFRGLTVDFFATSLPEATSYISLH